MADSGEANGRPKPPRDIGDGFVPIGDEEKLIVEPGAMESPGSSNGPKSEMSPLQMESLDAKHNQHALAQGLKIIIVSSICFAVSVTVALILTIFLAPPPILPHGAVSADVQECAVMGTDVMKKGGSAVDAAITTLLCVGVVNCQHSGIGGGGFMVVRQQKQNTTAIFDFREVAPQAATPDMFSSRSMATGALSVAVPGELKGMKAAHDQFGKLSWEDLIMPVVNLSRNGFTVTENLAYAIQTHLSPDEDSPLVDLLYPGGVALQAGDTLRRPHLADTLERIAKEGIEPFYSGTLADDIVNTVTEAGGLLQKQDLLEYTAVSLEPLVSTFLGLTLETVPAPSGGPLLVLLLHIMENYTLSRDNLTLITNDSDYMYYHRLAEAIKFTQAEWYRFGDPALVPGIDNATDTVISTEYAALLRSQISEEQTMSADYYMTEAGVAADMGTAHVSVVGPFEDYVSVTSTINEPFGSHLMTPSGIILNNEMADFSIPDADSGIPVNKNNLIAPRKRPMSSMCPTVVYSRDKPCGPKVALGGVNGSRIISGVAEVLINLLGFHQTLDEAIQMPRLYDVLYPSDVVEYDEHLDASVIKFLRQKGHTNFTNDKRGVNFVNAVSKTNETIIAVADPRQVGSGSDVF